MRVSLLAPLVILTIVGCGVSALSPFDSIEGQWEWQFNANPAGSGVSLSLTTSGTLVRGTGAICGVGQPARLALSRSRVKPRARVSNSPFEATVTSLPHTQVNS
jgi:hypothetical protein